MLFSLQTAEHVTEYIWTLLCICVFVCIYIDRYSKYISLYGKQSHVIL